MNMILHKLNAVLKRLGGSGWSAILITSSLFILFIGFYDFIIINGKDIGVNAIGAYLGFLGAAAIYIIQLGNETSKSKRETIEKHKEHLRYFAGVMGEVIKHAKAQAKALDEIKEAIEKEPSTIHQLGFVASDSIGRLNRADSEATFHAYNILLVADSMHESNYRTILSHTDSLTAQLGNLKQTFGHYRDNMYSRQLKLKDLLQNIADETSFLLRDIRQPGPYAAFAKYAPNAVAELNSLLLDYVELNASIVPFEMYFDKFIQPLKHWLSTYDSVLPLSGSAPERALNLVRMNKGASVTFSDLKSNATDFIKAFDSQKLIVPASKLEKFHEGLTKVVN